MLCFISETIQDRTIVTMEDELMGTRICDLSNNDIFNDLEWTLPIVRGHDILQPQITRK